MFLRILGARAQRGSVLSRLSHLQEAEQKLKSKQNELRQIEKQLENLSSSAHRYGFKICIDLL